MPLELVSTSLMISLRNIIFDRDIRKVRFQQLEKFDYRKIIPSKS